MEQKKSKFSLPVLLLLYFLIGILGICFVLMILWSVLEQYEVSRSDTTINDFVYRLNTEQETLRSCLQSQVQSMRHPFQSEEETLDYLCSHMAGSIVYTKQSIGEEERTFELYYDNQKFGTVTMHPDSSAKRFGMVPWTIDSLVFDFSDFTSVYTVTVPSNYTVEVNGVPADTAYVTETGIAYAEFADYEPWLVQAPRKTTYTIRDCYGDLPVQVLDDLGQVVDMQSMADELVPLDIRDEDQKNRMTDFTERFIRQYMYYTSGVYDNYSSIAGYIWSGGDLESRLYAAAESLYWAHTWSISFDEISVSRILDLGGNQYCIYYKVVFTPKGAGNGQTTAEYRMLVQDNETRTDARVIELDVM